MFSRLMFVLSMFSIIVLGVAVWITLDSPVRGLVISGDLSPMERQEVQQALSNEPYAGVLSTNLSGVAARLDHLPWAREITVRRLWPDQIEVTLQRAGPVARWGAHQFVSAYGDLLSLPDTYPSLPHFEVSLSTPHETMEVYRLLDQIGAREGLTISALQQNSQGEWGLRIEDGPAVLLGSEKLNQRMHRFLLVYRRVLRDAPRIAEYVDARYANGIAVRYAHSESEQPMLVAQRDLSTQAPSALAEGNH